MNWAEFRKPQYEVLRHHFEQNFSDFYKHSFPLSKEPLAPLLVCGFIQSKSIASGILYFNKDLRANIEFKLFLTILFFTQFLRIIVIDFEDGINMDDFIAKGRESYCDKVIDVTDKSISLVGIPFFNIGFGFLAYNNIFVLYSYAKNIFSKDYIHPLDTDFTVIQIFILYVFPVIVVSINVLEIFYFLTFPRRGMQRCILYISVFILLFPDIISLLLHICTPDDWELGVFRPQVWGVFRNY